MFLKRVVNSSTVNEEKPAPPGSSEAGLGRSKPKRTKDNALELKSTAWEESDNSSITTLEYDEASKNDSPGRPGPSGDGEEGYSLVTRRRGRHGRSHPRDESSVCISFGKPVFRKLIKNRAIQRVFTLQWVLIRLVARIGIEV
jgi:hypothetical protein